MRRRRQEAHFKNTRSRPRKRVESPPPSSSPAPATSAPLPAPAPEFYRKGKYHCGAEPKLNYRSTWRSQARARAWAAEFAANPPAELPARRPRGTTTVDPGSEENGGAPAASEFSSWNAAARLDGAGEGARRVQDCFSEYGDAASSSSANAAAFWDAPLFPAPPPCQLRALEPPLSPPSPPLSPPPPPPGVIPPPLGVILAPPPAWWTEHHHPLASMPPRGR